MENGVTQESGFAFYDELRVGLYGQVRRVWGIRGIKIRQKVELKREWSYCAIGVDGLRGALSWTWIPTMKTPDVCHALRTLKSAGMEAMVWDGAPAHISREVHKQGVTLMFQPAHSPEVNPAERVIEEVRRRSEGRVYGTIANKVAAVDRALSELAEDSEAVKRLAGWHWIREAYDSLPYNPS